MSKVQSSSSASSVSIKDTAGNSLTSTAGALDVNIASSGTTGTQLSLYDEISGIPSGVTSDVISYTVPIGQTFYLARVEVSGDNVATYTILINNIVNGTQRTYFGASLNTVFDYSDASPQGGFPISGGINLKIQVFHERPSAGAFEARIQGIEE